METAAASVEAPTEAPPARVFGVDMGSTRCVTVADTGDVVLNELGGLSTASMLSFMGNERLIGEAAVASSQNSTNTVDFLTQLLGKSVEAVQSRVAQLPGKRARFEAQNEDGGDDKPVAVVEYDSEQQSFSVEQLLAMLLGKMLTQMKASMRRGDDSGAKVADAVHVNFAVPSVWGEAEKCALYEATRIAGISSMAVLSKDEALAKCFHRKHPIVASAESEKVRHIVIVDMGHTSTSVAVVQLTAEGESIIATACDLTLGSENFDLHLYEHFRQEVEAKHQVPVVHHDKGGKRLLQSCAKLKALLSTITEASVTVENVVPDTDYELSISREALEAMCIPERERLRELVATVLEQAQVAEDAIVSVEIVGGGTRIPFVQQAILSAFPTREASFLGRMLDSTTSVAAGAAFAGALPVYEASQSEEKTQALEALADKEKVMQQRDADRAAIAHERNAIEAFVYDMRGKMSSKHGAKLDSAALTPLLDAAEEWSYSVEAEQASLETLRAKHAEIREQILAVCGSFLEAVALDERTLESQLEEESKRAEAERLADGGGDDHDTRKLKKPERMRLVVKNKEEGNELFRDGNHQHAAVRYVKALNHASKFFDLNENDTAEVTKLKLSLYLNLAQCYLKMEQWGQVIGNCKDALSIDPGNAKALYRRALALEKEKRIDEAVEDVKAALRVAPEDRAILKLDERLRAVVKRQLDKEKKMWGRAFA